MSTQRVRASHFATQREAYEHNHKANTRTRSTQTYMYRRRHPSFWARANAYWKCQVAKYTDRVATVMFVFLKCIQAREHFFCF